MKKSENKNKKKKITTPEKFLEDLGFTDIKFVNLRMINDLWILDKTKNAWFNPQFYSECHICGDNVWGLTFIEYCKKFREHYKQCLLEMGLFEKSTFRGGMIFRSPIGDRGHWYIVRTITEIPNKHYERIWNVQCECIDDIYLGKENQLASLDQCSNPFACFYDTYDQRKKALIDFGKITIKQIIEQTEIIQENLYGTFLQNVKNIKELLQSYFQNYRKLRFYRLRSTFSYRCPNCEHGSTHFDLKTSYELREFGEKIGKCMQCKQNFVALEQKNSTALTLQDYLERYTKEELESL